MASIIAQTADETQANPGVIVRRHPQTAWWRAAALWVALLAAVSVDAAATAWGCHGTKPGHPTAEERFAFIREVNQLAIKAERTHGVPATVLAAMAIVESGYGWTRMALHANNVFGWKFASSVSEEGRKAYVPPCRRDRTNEGYAVFKSKAEAFDFVAAKLATLDAYREYTESYQAARKRGESAEPALRAWLAGIAGRYSGKPAEFTKKITRVMNNAIDPADSVSPDYNLYHLSGASSFGR